MIKKKGALFLAMLLLSIYALPTMTEAKDRVSLKADTIRYAENNRIMIAKDNVHLSVGDTRITADRLRLDTVNNMAWASGNLTISQGEDTFYSAYAMIDLEKNTVQLEDVKLAMTPPGSAQKIYFSAHKLVDHDAHKSGTFGTVSTCEHDPPHYFMWAQHFDYHNKELIVAYNVLFYNPILFVPFGIWTPVYIYDISKRRVILNFPKIGRKEQPGWGWFVQSTIDYDSLYGKDSSVFFDWFENKGIGAGIKHQYEVGKNIGTLSYYNFDFDDNGQKKANRKMGWNNNFELDERLSINTIFDKIETDERINRSGSHKTENKSVQLNYDDLGDKYNVNIKENEDFNQSYKNFELSTKHMYNHEKRYDFNYSKNTNYIRQQENVIANGSHTLHLPDSTKLENRLRYRGDETWSDDEDRDEDLKTYSSFTRKISKNIDMRIDIDMFFDLEGNKVTTDEFSNKNDFLYKVPEINFKYTNIDLGPFIIEEDITIGRYKEVQYNSQFKTQRVFPDPDDFGFEPNAYIFKQTIRKTFDQLPLKSSFTAKTSHHQYIFKSPGHTLLNGDALNTFNLELKQSSDILSFLKMESTYHSVYSPKENGSPFFYFDKKTQSRNEFQETLSFYLFDISKYRWQNSTGYNWVTKKWRDFTTELQLEPDKAFSLNIRTGKRLSPKGTFDFENRFHPLNVKMNINPSSNFIFNYNVALDLNKWRDDNDININNSNFTIKYGIGGNKLYQWTLEGTFIYETKDQTGEFESNRYELQTFSIVKKEHRRKLSIGYRKAIDELFIKYTIDGFPQDPFELRKTNENWELEGRFNEQAEERFK